jgi:hypothetical protein
MRLQQFLFLTMLIWGNATLFSSNATRSNVLFDDSQARTDELHQGKGFRFAQGIERLRQQQAEASAAAQNADQASPKRHSGHSSFIGTRLADDFDQVAQKPNPWYKKIGQPALAYTFLTLLGFVHGVANNYLSKGAHNEHFFKAPLREWLVGLGFTTLQKLLIRFNKIPGNPRLNNPYLALFALCATLGGGQVLGEMIPLKNNGPWRNFAVNQWTVGVPVWLGLLKRIV